MPPFIIKSVNFVIMATVQQLYDTTQYLINKYDGSFMSQDEFLQAYNLASTDYFNYLTDMSYSVMDRYNVYSNPTNADNQVTEALSPFVVFEQALASPYNKPSDYARLIYLKAAYTGQNQSNAKYPTRTELTLLDSKLYSSIDEPIADDPIYVEVDGKFIFYPASPSVGVWATYYKKPVRRTAVDGTTVEWADNKVNNVLFRVLGYLGINLKDPSLIQFGNIKKVDA
jgi:hypothetical protein